VGVKNYQDLLSDAQVWQAIGVTLRFALLWLPVAIITPLAVALLLNSPSVRASSFFRVLFFLPYVVPFIAGVFIWQGMLDAQQGWVNGFLRLVGLETPPDWLQDPAWVHSGLVFIGIWGIGAGILINIAGLRGIPTELFDAARIDGAGTVATLRNVTLPMLSPVIFYTLVLSMVEVLQYFLVPLVIKNGTGEPGGTTLFYNLLLYKTFFTYQNMGYGATLAWVLFLGTLLITLILFAVSRRWVYYAGES
jgi:multiple sugar transport system permease protein